MLSGYATGLLKMSCLVTYTRNYDRNPVVPSNVLVRPEWGVIEWIVGMYSTFFSNIILQCFILYIYPIFLLAQTLVQTPKSNWVKYVRGPLKIADKCKRNYDLQNATNLTQNNKTYSNLTLTTNITHNVAQFIFILISI